MGKPQKHVPTYRPRQPENTALYKVLAEHVETFIAQRESEGKGLPEFVIKEFYRTFANRIGSNLGDADTQGVGVV